jgi:short-subunit dehydrogenase
MPPTQSAPPAAIRPLAVVTGASSGIGEAFARRLAPAHDLLLVARRKDRLDAVASEVATAHGTRAEILVADLGRQEDVARVAERLRREQNLELLVNNAGFGVDGLFWEGEIASHEQMHRLHILATLKLCHAALGNLVPRNRGAIVNVASVAAFVRGIGSGSYGATKSWMTAFTEGLHLDLRSIKSRVVVQALCPGFTYSEFHDTMGVRRERRAPRFFWLSADRVAAASLAGLRSGRLYVVPGWQYRILTALMTKLPNGLRVALESARPR